MKNRDFLNIFKKNPKKVFLMDAFGAIISLFSFLCILYPLETYFRIPVTTLFTLSIIAIFLFTFSFSCFKLIKQNWKTYLKIIIILNSLYILFSIGLVFYYLQQLTFLGVFYFIIEIAVILVVLYIEIITYLYQKKLGF